MNRITKSQMAKGEIYYIEIVGETLRQLQVEYPEAKGRYKGEYGGMYERVFEYSHNPKPVFSSMSSSVYYTPEREQEIPIRDREKVEYNERLSLKYRSERYDEMNNRSSYPSPRTCYNVYIYTWKFLPIDGHMGVGHEYFKTNVYDNKNKYPYATYGEENMIGNFASDTNEDIIYYRPHEVNPLLFPGSDSLITLNSLQGKSQDLPGGELPIPVTYMIIGDDYLIEVQKIKGNKEFNKKKEERKVSGYLIGTYKGSVKNSTTKYVFCNLREIYDYLPSSYNDMIPSGVEHDDCLALSLLDFSVFPILKSPPRLYREGVQDSIKNGFPTISSLISSIPLWGGKSKRKSKRKFKRKSKRLK